MTVNRQRLIAALFWIAIVAIGSFAYAPALGGAFVLDDLSNLNGLSQVEDRLSALVFVFSGEAGPLGRPLALATFLPQAAAWGENAEPFLRVNVLIHLLNGSILAWVLYRLCIVSRVEEGKAYFVTVAAAAIWLLMPLLASSSLMVIQRMTTLSATFALLGLAGYLQARQSIEHQPARSLILMSISLVVGTVLAALAKESGALLPTLVLAMEATVLSKPGNVSAKQWRVWKSVFLILPASMIIVFLIWCVPYSHELVLKRDFTAWERLLTESRILWQYLFYAFVPRPGKFGPFHDGYEVARTILDPLTVLAFFGWVITLVLAVVWRRRFPLFAFAVLWFLGGHLLESTVVPLELYFEHRNYLPIVGPIFSLCVFAGQLSALKGKAVYAGMGIYVLMNALLLFSLTSLWGNPAIAAGYWQAQFPKSVRAGTTAAAYHLESSGPQGTAQVLHRLAAENPEAGYLKIQELNLSCITAPRSDHQKTVNDLDRLLAKVDFSYTAGTMLSQLFTTVSRVECNEVNGDTVQMFADTLLGNPRYVGDASYRQLHHQLMARMLRHEGKVDQAVQQLEKAIEYGPSSRLNVMMVTTFAESGNFDAARLFVEQAKRNKPWRPMRAYLWMHELVELSRYIDEVEQHAKQEKDLSSNTISESKLP